MTIATTDGTMFTFTAKDDDEEQLGGSRMITSANPAHVNPIQPAQPGVYIVELTSNTPIDLADLISVEVHACKEPTTTTVGKCDDIVQGI